MGKANSANNRANQMNPNNDAYWQARGLPSRPRDWQQQDGKSVQEGNGRPGKGKGTRG